MLARRGRLALDNANDISYLDAVPEESPLFMQGLPGAASSGRALLMIQRTASPGLALPDAAHPPID